MLKKTCPLPDHPSNAKLVPLISAFSVMRETVLGRFRGFPAHQKQIEVFMSLPSSSDNNFGY